MSRGRISSGAWSYELTEEDLLWSARMVEGETIGGRAGKTHDALAVLWTMASLFSPQGQRAKYGRPDRFASFTDLIRAYSQPINPRWLWDGQFCRPGGRHHGTDACDPARLRARAILQRTRWGELDSELTRVVLAWASGQTRNPVPKAIEFAAHAVAESFIGRNAGAERVARIQNTFVATAESKRWRDLPKVLAPARRSGGVGWFVVGGIALGGALAWGLSQRKAS